jgi:hypothetical protein
MLCQHNRPISDCLSCHKLAPPEYDDTDASFYQFDDGTAINEYGQSDDTDAWSGITGTNPDPLLSDPWEQYNAPVTPGYVNPE